MAGEYAATYPVKSNPVYRAPVIQPLVQRVIYIQPVQLTAVRFGNITQVTASSGLTGTVYYHWYVDGEHVARTTAPRYSFFFDTAEQRRIDVKATNNADYDGVLNAPLGYPVYRTIYWIRSVDTDVIRYKIQMQKDSGDWNTIGYAPHKDETWEYEFKSPALTDLSTYNFRVYPIDKAKNDGTVITLGAEKVVRTPDAPNFTLAYDADTDKMTFTEVS